MYVIGSTGDDVNQYSLSVAWDITTASYVQNFSIAAQETNPRGLSFKPDGTKMYFAGSTGDDVNEYTLSTAWDISTASYVQNFSFAAQETGPTSFFFKPDGLKMYVLGATGDAVFEYTLSTAWDISTASYTQNFSIAAQDTTPTGLFFRPNGLQMYMVGQTNDNVCEYSLTTPWDISTASYLQSFNVVNQTTLPYGLFFKPDGLKMYILDLNSDVVFSYDFV
jgi:DNA-binding beta-propeller fold protein YncE